VLVGGDEEPHEHVKAHTNDLYDLTEKQQTFQRKQAYQGLELVQETHRLLLMNAMLHGIESPLVLGDALGDTGAKLPKADVILTNPPFGTKKGGGLPTRSDLTYATSNKQLAFLQHIYRNLKPGGRAAVVLPDNVLFEDGTGVEVRRDLMDKCHLHTVLRLPTGIFYAQGVKTNVLFFRKGELKDTGNTKAVWVFDLRTNMPQFGKRTPLTPATFKDFEHAFGTDPNGQSKRKDQGEEGRFRKFTREQIAARGDNLDITWLRDENATNAADLPPPDEIAARITARLKTALQEMDKLTAAVGGEE
jgi:type I restriction enzyme M protein